LKKNVTCGYFSVSAQRNWRRPSDDHFARDVLHLGRLGERDPCTCGSELLPILGHDDVVQVELGAAVEADLRPSLGWA
jgi:hypothetical protein